MFNCENTLKVTNCSVQIHFNEFNEQGPTPEKASHLPGVTQSQDLNPSLLGPRQGCSIQPRCPGFLLCSFLVGSLGGWLPVAGSASELLLLGLGRLL